MITAAEALRLPSAKLTEEEARAADVVDQAIDNHVRAHMTRAGIGQPFTTTEKRPAVIAEVAFRLKHRGWIPQWEMLVERGRFSDNMVQTGWILKGLGPSDEADRASGQILASA